MCLSRVALPLGAAQLKGWLCGTFLKPSERPMRRLFITSVFEFEFLLIESIPTNLLLRGHNIRLRCGSKAGPDVRAFRERTGHRSLSCNLESCLALCTGPPYVSDRDVRGETRKNSCHFALAASGAGTIVVRIELYALPVTLDIQSTLLTLHFHAS